MKLATLVLALFSLLAIETASAATSENIQNENTKNYQSSQLREVTRSIDFQNQLESAKQSEVFHLNRPVVRMQTTMIVPPKPNKQGTMFIWPGLQSLPWGENWDPIGNGVLQPVLTWGDTCAPTPNQKPQSYSTWWISGQYVNTDASTPPEYAGCHSGRYITAEPGDYIFIDIALDQNTNIWTQTVTNQMTNAKETYLIDLKGQSQMLAEFLIEPYYGSKVFSPVTFLHTKITYSQAGNCNDFVSNGLVSTPVIQDGGLTCFIDSLILKQK